MQTAIDRAAGAGKWDRVATLEAEIEPVPLPASLLGIWRSFNRLSSRRGNTGFGPAPIGWQDLGWYQQITGDQLGPWDIEMIELLDAAYLGAIAKRSMPPNDKPGGS